MKSFARRHAVASGATRAAIFLAFALRLSSAGAMITVGPDDDPDCQFHDVTSAIISADQSPGIDLVAIAAGTYTGVSTATVVSTDDLIVEGGYASCSAGISSHLPTTLDANGAIVHGSVIQHVGSGRLTLLHLTLTGGSASVGGGVDSEGAGALVLSDVTLLSNAAGFGGGMFVLGGGIPHKSVTLVGVRFNSNVAHGSGGGLYARNADVRIESGSASYFLGNFANGDMTDSGDGGGLYALDSNVVVNTHGVAGFPFIGSNIAHRNGGGAYFGASVGDNLEFFLSNDSALQPLEISFNAAQEGGAIYMKSASANQPILSFARIRNAIFRNNQANYGAVASVDSNGQTANVETGLRFEQSRLLDDTPPCAAGLECNLMESNLAYDGYIVSATASGPSGGAYVEMFRGRMIDNSTVDNGGGLIFGGNARVYIDGGLFAFNSLSGELFTVVANQLHLANSTVAHNTLGADQLVTVAITPASLDLLHNLFSQPNDPVDAYLVGAGIPIVVRDIGAESVGGLPTGPGNNVQFLSDPFVDAANGDFHIRQTSSAVDRWATSGDPNDPAPTLDLDGALRPHVFNSTSTPYDFGAYEAGAVTDAIFIDGFDDA